MDRQSLDFNTRHIRNVLQTEYDISTLSEDQILDKVKYQVNAVSARWASCSQSFTTLFTTLNKNNRTPKDAFDIVAKKEMINSMSLETRIRLEREKNRSTFVVRPYIVIGETIIDKLLSKEVFSSDYLYTFGTYRSQIATISVKSDGNSSELFLNKLNGYIVNEMTPRNNAILLASLDDIVQSEVTDSEDTLILLWGAVSDPDLNPQFSRSF